LLTRATSETRSGKRDGHHVDDGLRGIAQNGRRAREPTPEQRQSLLWSINLSLGVGILMLLLKFTAYWVIAAVPMRGSFSDLPDSAALKRD